MELISFVLTIVGFGMSGYAIYQAKTARDIANSIIGKKNRQEDSDRLKTLIVTLNIAKDAAMRRQGGAPEFLSAGHDPAHDLQALRYAHDALKTKLPFSFDETLRSVVEVSAEELQKALENIDNIGANRDGWKDALSTLQTLIPRLEQEERKLRDQALLAEG